jgi:hypothetical protein
LANVKKIFSSKTAWPNGAKLGIDGPWVCPFQNCVLTAPPSIQDGCCFFKVMIISLWNLLQYHSIVRWAIQAQWAEPLVSLMHQQLSISRKKCWFIWVFFLYSFLSHHWLFNIDNKKLCFTYSNLGSTTNWLNNLKLIFGVKGRG